MLNINILFTRFVKCQGKLFNDLLFIVDFETYFAKLLKEPVNRVKFYSAAEELLDTKRGSVKIKLTDNKIYTINNVNYGQYFKKYHRSRR